ncbi:MAG: helix-turn-helix domain-containing protein, partial [Candidatus Rokubacteria bacterium]|nr:helix-turn-helix domain-containing protein [Candidatus Rokubacteria bacterium]
MVGFRTHHMRTRKPLRFAAFGSLLRDARIARKITQAQLARRLKVGQQAVSNWERGTSRPETEALLDRLAQIFPEHDRVAWLQLIGSSDKPTAREIQKPQPVQPLLETLPLDRLSFQQFQTFSALLLELLYSNATVNAFGLEGDTQDGIDIEVRFSDGRYETFQCKRQKTFGPEKVRRAMRKHRVKCNRAVILLSRNATAAARKAVPKSGRWDLWDTEDIARKIRTLPLAKQRRIVDTYFRAYRKAFLGLDDESAFESPEEHFGPLLHRDQVFSHAWTLAGRDRELERLIAMTDRERRQVTLLIGSGGIGKSRLIRAISESYRANRADHAVFILSVGRAPSAADFDALNDQPSLVIIEDAHEQPDIGALLARLARASLPIRLLITTRPYAAQLIRSEARHNGLHADENGSVILQPLTVDQAESVAREILHDRKGPVGLARQIAWLTRGSPLALVVGSYLVATARIHPAALNNSQEFIGHQPEHEIIRNTLDLIALLQPIDPESTSMASVAQQVLHFSMDRVKRAIQLLHDAGVLVRRGRMFRIVPDLFAEYVLEDASVLKATGRSSGYVERIVPACDEGQLANMLLNISKLDWRLTEADESQSQLADAVWLHIETAYDSSPAARDTVVEAVAGAAYYQPRRALKFYDRLSERGHWHRELPILLKHVALNVEYIEQAASR